MEQRYMQIGQAAERTGLTQRTLRFYEEKRLLNPPTRMEGGFRLYSEEDIQRIEHILQLKQNLGFSLADIREMLEAEEAISALKAQFREFSTEQKIESLENATRVIEGQMGLIERKIDQLSSMRDFWQQKRAKYNQRVKEIQDEQTSINVTS
ncbi:MAG: MerR family transcriptional regulator [Dehalococcoidia bacterium]|nr:MerR family transcriptional regulator [Dehalococcoidia bacterium]